MNFVFMVKTYSPQEEKKRSTHTKTIKQKIGMIARILAKGTVMENHITDILIQDIHPLINISDFNTFYTKFRDILTDYNIGLKENMTLEIRRNKAGNIYTQLEPGISHVNTENLSKLKTIVINIYNRLLRYGFHP